MHKVYQIYLNGDCNLRCKYCFEHKKNRGVNDRASVIAFVHAIINEAVKTGNSDPFAGVQVDFIGGEPFLYVGLMRECVELFMQEGVKHRFTNLPTFSISTNGTLFDRPEVRDFIETYGRFLSIGFSIDGTKECHDTNRVDIHGNGSWDKAVEGWRYVRKHICLRKTSVKATFNHDTMHRYAESLINLIELGFVDISANAVFEETWTDEDSVVFFDQMMFVHRYLKKHGLLDTVHIKQINPHGSHYERLAIGEPVTENRCGSCEHMRALGFDGKIYGCHRFACEEHYAIGHIDAERGIVLDVPQFIDEVKQQYQDMPDECKDCAFAQLCGYCVALPYELGQSAKEFFAEKRQCGFVRAVGWAMCAAFAELSQLTGDTLHTWHVHEE